MNGRTLPLAPPAPRPTGPSPRRAAGGASAVFGLLALGLGLYACGNGQGNTSASSTTGAAADLSPQEVCGELLTCIERSDSPIVNSYGAFVAQYGPTGTCWQSYTAAECQAACVSQLAAQGCNFCQSNVPCDGTHGLACDEAAHACVQCLTDQDCVNTPGFVEAGRPFCYPAANTCGQCKTDADCAKLGQNLTCVFGGTCQCEQAYCPGSG